jgi:CRP/FNR family transcriptional regulator, cyclic AMP receptor protein
MTMQAQSEELHFAKGTVIFRQGDPGEQMFVISAGRVGLKLESGGHEKEIAVLNTGDFFGELSLLSGAARTATAVALEESTLLAIGRDVFAMMVQDDLDIVFRMMNIQGQRLSQTNQPIQELMERLGRIRVASHCLRRCLAAEGQLPQSVDIEPLGKELDVNSEAVRGAVEDLVRAGAGSLQNGRWTIHSQDQMDKLVEVLCRYADQRATLTGSGV